MCRAVEACGATFVTVHGRTPSQRAEPVNTSALQQIRDCVGLPLIANGDVRTLQDAEDLQQSTGYNGKRLDVIFGHMFSIPNLCRHCYFKHLQLIKVIPFKFTLTVDVLFKMKVTEIYHRYK